MPPPNGIGLRVQAPVGAAAVDEPDVRGDARGDRRQPERKHARQAERDQRVEPRLRHGRAFRVTTRSASRPGPSARTRNDERAAPRRRQRELHALACRAGVRPPSRRCGRCGRPSRRRAWHCSPARARRCGGGPARTRTDSKRARGVHLHGRRRGGGGAELDRADVGHAHGAREAEEVVGGRDAGIAVVDQQRARGGGRAVRVEVRVADHVASRVQAWPDAEDVVRRCGCGRTCRRSRSPVLLTTSGRWSTGSVA